MEMVVIRWHKRVLAFFSFQISSMMCQFSVVESKSATFPTERPRHLLDDSVLESQSPTRSHILNSLFTNGISIGRDWVGDWLTWFSLAVLLWSHRAIQNQGIRKLSSSWAKTVLLYRRKEIGVTSHLLSWLYFIHFTLLSLLGKWKCS